MDSKLVFKKIGSLVLVGELQSSVSRYFSAHASFEEINDDFVEDILIDDQAHTDPIIPSYWTAVITQQSKPVGYLAFNSYPINMNVPEDAENAGDVMLPLNERLISSEATYMEAIEKFGKEKQPFFFVDHHGDISGVLFYRDLFKPLGKIALFSLVQELEAVANDLCIRFPKECFSALREKRQHNTYVTFLRKLSRRKDPDFAASSRSLYHHLIEATMFIDKIDMICKCKLLSDWADKNVESVFQRAENLRNACAHPTRADVLEEILELDKLGTFIHDCTQLIESIRLHTR